MKGASIWPYKGKIPTLGQHVFLASGVHLIGDLEVGADSSFWFNTVVRADVNIIRIGSRTNVQDNTVIHVTSKTAPTHIGSDVTIGHSAIIHGCTIEDLVLIGMGAKILDGAIIRKYSLVGAGAIVPPGKDYPERSLILGAPAKAVRQLSEEEIKGLYKSSEHYVETARVYAQMC